MGGRDSLHVSLSFVRPVWGAWAADTHLASHTRHKTLGFLKCVFSSAHTVLALMGLPGGTDGSPLRVKGRVPAWTTLQEGRHPQGKVHALSLHGKVA